MGMVLRDDDTDYQEYQLIWVNEIIFHLSLDFPEIRGIPLLN